MLPPLALVTACNQSRSLRSIGTLLLMVLLNFCQLEHCLSELVALEDTAEEELVMVMVMVVLADTLMERQTGSWMMAIVVAVVDCNVRNLARSMSCSWAALRS